MFAIGDLKWPGLSKLVEEAGELLQVVGRLMATHGEEKHWSGANLTDDFLVELGDLAAAIEFVVGFLTLDQRGQVSLRKRSKLVVFRTWHRESTGDDPWIDAPSVESNGKPRTPGDK